MSKKYFHSLAEGAQVVDSWEYALTSLDGFGINRVAARLAQYEGRQCIEAQFNPDAPFIGEDPPDFVYLPDLDLHNGVIEVDVAGSLAPGAPGLARGFVGVAFRITPDFAHEGFYIRPANGRAEEQIRRNHSCQYYAYPDYPWSRLRKEEPEKYESYVDLELGAWTHLRVELRDSKARLYVHDNAHPTLVVNDMKADAGRHGSVGLWLCTGTLARFSNLKITKWK